MSMEFGHAPKNLKTAIWKNAVASIHRRFIKRTTGGVDYATADTDVIIGVLYSDGVAQNAMVAYFPLVPGEEILVDCGAANIAENAVITATTAGEAVTLTPAVAKFMAGVAIQAGTANKVFKFMALPGYTSA